MTETLGDFEFKMSLDKALADVEELENALDRIAETKPPQSAYEALSRELAKAKAEAQKLTEAQKASKKAADEQAAAAAKVAASQEKAAKAAAEQSQRVRSNAIAGLGGEELPERLKKIGESFSVVGDRSAGFGARLTGVLGVVGLAAPAIGLLGSAVHGAIEYFGLSGPISSFADSLRSAITGSETHVQTIVRETQALVQLQMATARAAVETQKHDDALGSLKDRTDDYAQFLLHGAMDQAWKAAGIADQNAIEQLQDLHERHLEAAVGTDNLAEAERRSTEATQRQAEAVVVLRNALQDAAKAQGDLSYEVRQGESAADRITRIFRASTLQHERQILENRERRQITRAERQNLIGRGYQAREVDQVLGISGGGNGALQALRQAKLEYADVVRQLDDAGVVFEQRARKNHESMTAYFRSLHTEAQAALAAQHKQNDLLAAQHDLEKQLQLDAERKQRDLIDANRELEKRGSLIRQQFADMARTIGDTSTNASVQRAAEESLGLRGFVPGGEDRSQQRSVLMGRIASLGAEAAANPQDEVMQMQLQQQAQAIQQTIQQYDQLRTAQMDALDWSRQFTLAFQSHAELTNSAAQNLAQSASGAYSTLTSAVTTHFAALIDGQEDAATAGRLFVNQISTQVASQSLPLALFETAQAIGAAASYRFVEAGQHAAAAGIYFGLTAGGAALAAATSPASAKSTASTGGFNEPARSTPASSERDSGGRTVVFNYYGGQSLDTKDDIARSVVHLLDHGAALGHVPRATLREGR